MYYFQINFKFAIPACNSIHLFVVAYEECYIELYLLLATILSPDLFYNTISKLLDLNINVITKQP